MSLFFSFSAIPSLSCNPHAHYHEFVNSFFCSSVRFYLSDGLFVQIRCFWPLVSDKMMVQGNVWEG